MQTTIGISVIGGNDLEMIRAAGEVGFGAISIDYIEKDDYPTIIRTAKESGLLLQSMHAPFGRVSDLWSHDRDLVEPCKEQMFHALSLCAQYVIPVLVAHVWIGFDYEFHPETLRFDAFDEIVRRAEELGVRIAFENTEGEEYLNVLMQRYATTSAVGFCWDSGHEMCYNHAKPMLEMYADRLIMTHLNDNLGISDPNGSITWLDDLHLLPFDGIIDWGRCAERLQRAQRQEIYNFELNVTSKPGRHENDGYAQMPLRDYLREAYGRAQSIVSQISLEQGT